MKFFRQRKVVIGYAQRRALEMLSRRHANAVPRPGEVTPTGILRFHTFMDLVADGLVKATRGRPNPETGETSVVMTITPAGRDALATATVAKAPERRPRARSVPRAGSRASGPRRTSTREVAVRH